MEKPLMEALAQRMVAAVRSAVHSLVLEVERGLSTRIDDAYKAIDAANEAIALVPAGPRGVPGESVRGEKGEPGIDGRDGPPGRDGLDVDKEAVIATLRADLAEALAVTPKAVDGRDGRDGKDGEPGRDAASLIVLPSIDESKGYARGTWASHTGGLIQAVRRTDPVIDGDLATAGWAVMLDGVAAVVVTQGDDPRVIEVATLLTSGTKTASTFSVPMMIDRGVWKAGITYDTGDTVSFDGSGWIAQRTTTDKPGGEASGWRLSTKRGRDGKSVDGGATVKPSFPPPRLK